MGDDFTPPSRNEIAGDLLTKNYNSYKQQNKTLFLQESKVFGTAWMGAGATTPVFISINKCTEHMLSGGKKEAVYIAQMFEGDISEYDVDVSNVQKAGEILTTKYP